MKRGFTLIELLAVIVILAIVALIATPLILNVIDNAKKGAFENSVYGIIEATEFKYAKDVLKGNGEETTYIFDDGKQVSPEEILNIKGQKPQKGEIKVNHMGEIALALYDGKYCAEKSFKSSEVKVYEMDEEDCEIIFLPSGGVCGDNIIDDRDSENIETYKTVKIGDQCWFAENLRYTGSGCSGDNWTDGSYNDCIAFDEEDEELEKIVYYQWGAAQTACPPGWRLPSDSDWKYLEGSIDTKYGVGDAIWDQTGIRGYNIGSKLRTEYPFFVIPVGYITPAEEPQEQLARIFWWTSSESTDDTTEAWYRSIEYVSHSMGIYRDEAVKANGYTIRCVLDN